MILALALHLTLTLTLTMAQAAGAYEAAYGLYDQRGKALFA